MAHCSNAVGEEVQLRTWKVKNPENETIGKNRWMIFDSHTAARAKWPIPENVDAIPN